MNTEPHKKIIVDLLRACQCARFIDGIVDVVLKNQPGPDFLNSDGAKQLIHSMCGHELERRFLGTFEVFALAGVPFVGCATPLSLENQTMKKCPVASQEPVVEPDWVSQHEALLAKAREQLSFHQERISFHESERQKLSDFLSKFHEKSPAVSEVAKTIPATASDTTLVPPVPSAIKQKTKKPMTLHSHQGRLYRIIEEIYISGGGLSPVQLSSKVHMSIGVLHAQLGRLLSGGYVRRSGEHLQPTERYAVTKRAKDFLRTHTSAKRAHRKNSR